MKIFYHSADLDGHCSGAIIKYKYPEGELIGINYGQKFPYNKIEFNETVFIVDFTIQPFTGMLNLNTWANLIWIDHHETEIEEYKKYNFLEIQGKREIGKGACEIIWEYLFSDIKVPEAVRLLSLYDVWKYDDRALEFQYGMRLMDTQPIKNFDLWCDLFKDSGLFINEIIDNGKIILEYEKQQAKKYCSAYCFETELVISENWKWKAICCNKGFVNSNFFKSIWNVERYDLMISFVRLKSKEWTVHLYSDKENIDCGKIAKLFGGGGHKGASGFQCKELPFKF